MENNEKWITKKELAIPIISMVCFLFIIVGASYAYYTTSAPSGTATTFANEQTTTPGNATTNCTFIASGADCALTSSATAAASNTDAVISRLDMDPSYAGQSVAQKSCYLNVTLSGVQACTCTYKINVTTSTADSSGSFKAEFNSQGSTPTLSIAENTMPNFVANFPKTVPITIATTGTNVTHSYKLDLKFYNLNSSQDAIAGKTFKYVMTATATECNGKALS